MSLDSAALLALATDILNAEVSCGAVPNLALQTRSFAWAAAISTFVKKAEVDPAGLPTPLTAPTGGGPVTGTGKIT